MALKLSLKDRLQKYFAVAFLLVFANALYAGEPPREVPEFAAPYRYARPLVKADQTLNDRVENTSEFESHTDSDLPKKYWPELQPVFALETVLVEAREIVIIDTTGRFAKEMAIVRKGKTFYPFYVHPVSHEHYARFFEGLERIEGMVATPFASHRSLLAWLETQKFPIPVFLKVSVDANIGEVRRLLTRAQIERASAASMALHLADMSKLNQHGIYFIDEPFSIYLKGTETGYTIRESVKLNDNQELLSLFSVYAKQKGGSKLQHLVEQSGLTPKEFARERIMLPLLEQMFVLAFTEGILPDPHEQNVGVLLENGEWTGQFYYRDLGGVNINTSFRALAGKDMSFVPASFDMASLGTERADLIDKIHTYLFQSNFYALAAAIRDIDPEITRAEIMKDARTILRSLIMRYTGYDANKIGAQKTVMKRYLENKMQLRGCSQILTK